MTWLVSYIIAGLAAASQTFSPGVSFTNTNDPADKCQVTVSRAQPADETESFEETYPLNANGKVSISNINGSITIEAWDCNEVKVKATKTADTRERLEEVKIEIDSTRDRLRINTHFLPWSKRSQSHRQSKLEVAYHLTVPRGAVLDQVEAVNGNVMISGVGNVTKVSAVNGTVKAVNLQGTASLSSVNGTVTAEFASLSNSKGINLTTVNGKAYLVIPSDSNATIKADSLNGAITNDFGLNVRKGKYVGRDLYGKVGDGTVKIFLESVNGPLTINRLQDGKAVNGVINLLPTKPDDNDPDEDMDIDMDVSVDVNVQAATSSGQGTSISKDCPKAEKDCPKAATSTAPMTTSRSSATRRTSRGSGTSSAQYPAPARAPRPAVVPSVVAVPAVPAVPAVTAVPPVSAVTTTVNSQGQVVWTTRQQTEAALKSLETAIKANQESIAKNLAKIAQEKNDAELVRQLELQNSALGFQNNALKLRMESLKKLTLATENYTSYGPYYAYSLSGASAAPTTETVSNSFQTKDKPKVIINASETEVYIRGWDKKEVKYTLTKVSREDFRSAPVYKATQDGSTINIMVKAADTDSQEYQPGRRFARSRIEIFVPRKSDLKINTSREMRVEGVNGKIELTGSDEAVNVRDSGGDLFVSTADGPIRVIGFDGAVKSVTNDGLTSLEGDFSELYAETKDGKIILTLPEDANVNIESNRKELEADGYDLEEVEDRGDTTVWKVGNGGSVHKLYAAEDGQVYVRSAGKITAEK